MTITATTATTEGLAFMDSAASETAVASAAAAKATGRSLIAIGINAGVGLSVAGFALIFFTWARVAGEKEVHDQLPYFVASGLGGLGLILVGLAVASIAVGAREAAEEQRQLRTVISLLGEIRDAVDDSWGGS